MSANPTPGPWEATVELGRSLVYEATTLKNVDICTMSGTGATEVANARLIAAAPDLLAALQSLLDPATNEDGEWYRQARNAARAAIAKAVGGEA